MKIEIVTHVFAGALPQYWQALCFQLSAAFEARDLGVRVVVATCDREADDPLTHAVMDHFRRGYNGATWLEHHRYPKEKLFRRSIARNVVAKRTAADIMIFTDVDYIWTRSALAELPRVFDHKQPLNFTRYVWQHVAAEDGDRLLAFCDEPKFVLFDPPCSSAAPAAGPVTTHYSPTGEWVHRRETRGIGGNQIVPGSYCRERGYLDSYKKFQQPIEDTSVPFANFRDDSTFRRQAGASIGIKGRRPSGRRREYWGHPILLPGVLRLRHVRAPYKDLSREEGNA